jgi:hypothetical protein
MPDPIANDVLLPEELEDRVRSYAESHLLKRSEAIRVLVEAGLNVLSEPED